MNSLSFLAIDAVLHAQEAFCKFLSANDSGETGGHQSGILISKSAWKILFTEDELRNNHILKKDVQVKWQDDFMTDSVFTWYESKNELRLTRFGRGFSLLRPEYTGALFVLAKIQDGEFEGFVLNTEEDIQRFLDEFGLTPAETNRPIEINKAVPELAEKTAFDDFISKLKVDFPTSDEMSVAARNIYQQVHPGSSSVQNNPDRILLDWVEEEYRLFRALEYERYGEILRKGFSSVDEFIVLANKVLNRRKSRAGKSLEHHLSAIFDGNDIQYTAQGVTEGNKKPDFIFPSVEAYHDLTFSVENLCILAAKTTCKDRWRQVLNEADRLRDRHKYLCTMQQGISSAQMDEMQAEQVILVVPKPYISAYPGNRQDRIWTIGKFVRYVREMERL
ncbi:MAG: type II restriction endonuclease [Peptoniphilaceae bacterium]|nr:type II restriction endonuclease [Peptoniphilaceae bacterium]MDY3076289.1 type II restriction endonuclease [Peptoniphilaceae bacterium]